MQRRHFQRLTALLAACLVVVPAVGEDLKHRPPEVRQFDSASGRYRLEVRGTPGWRSPQAVATMQERLGGTTRMVWSEPLAQRLGPRFAVVCDDGRAVLFDEWIRTPSAYAVAVLAPDGQPVATHSMDDIARLAGTTSAQLVRQARVGSWMHDAPVLHHDGQSVRVQAGAVALIVDAVSGQVRRYDAGATSSRP